MSIDNEDSGGDKPVMSNNQEGAAAWVNEGENGPYLSVQLPLGLGSVNLFPNNDAVVTALNHVLDENGGGGD